MPSAITRTNPNRRSRRLSGTQRPMQRGIPITVVEANKSGSVITIEFDQAVALKGVPQYTTDLPDVDPVSAVAVNPMTVAVTFSAAVTSATTLNIPFEDGAIRNASGGYANAGPFPVS
jgi:hypothetical protein